MPRAARIASPFGAGSRSRGFTLIELVITLLILGILSAIAVPNYFDFVRRSKIIDATARLGDMRSQMEKFFMDNRTYVNGAACGIDAAPLNLIAGHNADPGRQFDLACAATPTTYVIGVTGVAAKGMSGFRYSIDQANNKLTVSLPAGWAGAGNPCFVLRKDGSC